MTRGGAGSTPQPLPVRLALCGADSPDAGSARIRLPPSAWAAAGIAYHKPVVVSVQASGGGGGKRGEPA